jgi:fatty-acyl-CoA synthase
VNAYLHGPSATPLLGETIGENLRRTVERFGDRDALVVRSQNYRATYRQLWDSTTSLARALLASGVQQGDRVGIWSPNRFEWVVTQFAAARIGAILVNINPAYKASELRYALVQSGTSLLIHAKAFRTSDYVQMVERGAAHCPALREAITIDTTGGPCSNARSGLVGPRARGARIDPAVRRSRQHPVHVRHHGLPEGRDALASQHPEQRILVGEMIKYTEQDRVCIPVPFYHCFGMVMGNLGCTSHGACMVIPAEAFDPLATLEAVPPSDALRCTAFRRCSSRNSRTHASTSSI